MSSQRAVTFLSTNNRP